MKIVVLHAFALEAEICLPMYDEFPELGTFSSRRVKAFHKGEIIDIDSNGYPLNCFTEYGEKLYFTEAVPVEYQIRLTKRNQKMAYLFSRKMEDVKNLENALRESEVRTEWAVAEIPESESIPDALYFARNCNASQLETMKLLFQMDSLASQISQYEKMLQKRCGMLKM